MQERHRNRKQYFKELAYTSEHYYIPYIKQYHDLKQGSYILEVGCGEGGNLLPFSKMGCFVTGVDIARSRIEEAKLFFKQHNVLGTFIAEDVFKLRGIESKFDVIICHDVLEHIYNKLSFLITISKYLREDGILFMSFPAWLMPFGGHQQICRNRICSHMPFIHYLPTHLYKNVLKLFNEDDGCIKELLSIKQTRVSVENFEKIVRKHTKLHICDKQLYLVNPHYKIKFGLNPIKLPIVISYIPFVRNFFSTSCFYILSVKHSD